MAASTEWRALQTRGGANDMDAARILVHAAVALQLVMLAWYLGWAWHPIDCSTAPG